MAHSTELKSSQGPITIERLKPQSEYLTQLRPTSYTFTGNCTSLNLQFISVQKMDRVLHSIQRRIYKQKEQLVFAEFINSNFASTETGTRFVQIDAGQVCFQTGSKETFKDTEYRPTSGKVQVGSHVKRRSDSKAYFSNENVLELVNELKMCIATLSTTADHGNNIQLNNDDKPYFPQKKDKRIDALSRNNLTIQTRAKNTNFIKGTTVNKRQERKKVEHKARNPALITKNNKRTRVDLKESPKSVVLYQPSPVIKHGRSSESSSRKDFDALASWKMLSEMEKVEELVLRNLETINTDIKEDALVIGRKEVSENTDTNAISRGNIVYGSESDEKSSTHRKILESHDVAAVNLKRNHDYRFQHHNPSFATKFLAPNPDIVATIKELSNTVVDGLLTEVANEILDLPDAFLNELLQTEFANNLQR